MITAINQPKAFQLKTSQRTYYSSKRTTRLNNFHCWVPQTSFIYLMINAVLKCVTLHKENNQNNI